MGNKPSNKAVEPRDGVLTSAQLPEREKQRRSWKPSSKKNNDTHRQSPIVIEDMTEDKLEELSSNRNIETDQLPQKLRQHVPEGYASKEKIEIHRQSGNWRENKLMEPSSKELVNVDLDMLPPHWKDHVREEPSSDGIEWFLHLLAAYKQHKTHILEILSKSNFNEETINFPSDMNDEAFDEYVRKSCTGPTYEIPHFSAKTAIKEKLHDCINKCLNKKMSLITLRKIHEEHNRLREQEQNEISQLKKHIESLKEKNSNIIKEKDKALRRERKSEKSLNRIQDQLEQETENVRNIQHQFQQVTKEKEHLLTRLSKIAGSKLTSNNPDIADLNDDNRPTKLAEKFGQLYDDAWTDSMEELTGVETRLDDREAISFLLRIVMTAYQFCSGSRSMFLDLTDCQTIVTCKDNRAMKAITKLPDAITPDIQQATKTCLRAKETTLIFEMQEKFANTLNGILCDITKKADSPVSNRHTMNPRELVEVKGRKNECLDQSLLDFTGTHSQSKGVKDYFRFAKKRPHSSESTVTRRKNVSISASADFSQSWYEHYSRDKFDSKIEEAREPIVSPTYCQTMLLSSLPQFAKTTHFAERCVELCWFMQTTRPPIHLSASIPTDGRMKNDVLRAYTKSGTNVDYIVWPVIYLYENGPVLNKGIAQPK